VLRDLVILKTPPEKRAAKATGGNEMHLTEAAVMLAFAFHLFRRNPSLTRVEIHPDGEHGKRFDIQGWLESQGFALIRREGTTSYGGEYSDGSRELYVSLKPGLGDVVTSTNGVHIVAECKGGIINSKHAGQKSRLRKGLCEAVGLLLSRPIGDEMQFAVVPKTQDTETLSGRMIARCKTSGIGICLVGADGSVFEVGAS